MFIETTRYDYLIALSEIKEIGPVTKDLTRIVITDNGNFTIHSHVWDDAQKNLRQIIPASPGFFIIAIFDKVGDDLTIKDIYRLPILAWRSNDFGYLDPVSLEKTNEDWAIQCPDGSVVSPEDQSWDNVDGFLQTRSQQRRERSQKNKPEK